MKAKQILASALAAAALLASLPAALAADSEIPAARGEVCAALIAAADDYNPGVTAADVMHGDPDGNLRENAPVTRAEALIMLQRAFGGLPAPQGDNARKGYPASNFTDVPAWAKEELADVFAAGIVAGTSSTTFSPDENVTMEQLDKFIHRTYTLFGSNLKDDFYASVNKDWLDSSVIPAGQSSTGTLYEKMYDTEPLNNLIERTVANPVGEDAQRIAALYTNILDWNARNMAGIEPIRPYLEAAEAAQSVDEVMEVKKQLAEELAGNALVGFTLSADAKDSTRYTVGFSAFSPSLSKDTYANGGSQKDAYLTYIQTLFEIGGADEASAAADAQRVWEMEKELSTHALDRQDYGNVDKTYNVYTMDELKSLYPTLDLDDIYAQSGLARSDDQIVVSDIGLLEASPKYFTEEHLTDLKAYLRLTILAGYGGMLSQDFQDASDAYQEAFLGISGTLSDEALATQLVQQYLSDELGRLYAAEYFSEEAKADVEDMVYDFIDIYESRIRSLDWMSDATKAKAIEKLDALGVKVGYPDEGKWNDYFKGVTLKTADEGGSYFDNIITLLKAQQQMLIKWQGQPVNKGLWPMAAYTVNACYVPSSNEIVFPAGILQAPLYDVNASREENLGGIGYIIAHEITHAFDNNGAKYDKNGNAADWWTAEDYAAFQQLCDEVTAFYDGVEAAPGITCNGALTLSENIADLGAAQCILEAVQRETNPDLKAMFRAMANTWCSTMPRETAAYYTTVDVHAPDKLRANRVLQTLDAFYTTFGITEGDGMWIAPEDRVAIW
ncbi:MAG: S-layer homology domain-containing protein [Clostridiaceae bacterium]|nr:S-layer homology domain-containing protein [Clostridiaceae bacterium]